eukprot:TRINITY_DN35848_c0_g1_i1.p1 TRINITY_DN35848_c0_g1~~TRINITY_DN35848_c0_g1_i1.p1  ORF type:complete len:127 (-),score=14.14 TRINITY_DN35848_c0_g1_i1:589-969(-)
MEKPETGSADRLVQGLQSLKELSFVIAMGHYSGLGDVPQNHEEALRFFQVAAALGQIDAHTFLGRLYMQGDVVEKDDAKAFAYFSHSAARGDKDERWKLEIFHETRTGVPVNFSEFVSFHDFGLTH